MNKLKRKIIEILAEYKNGLTRSELIDILEKQTGTRFARSTVFDNIPHEIVKRVAHYNTRGRPNTVFKLISGYEAYINEE